MRPKALTVGFRQPAQHLLEFLPRGNPFAHRLRQGLRHVVTTRGPLGSAETHVEMGTMLVTAVAAAAGAATGTIGLGERAEQGTPGQREDAAQKIGSAGLGVHNRFHRL